MSFIHLKTFSDYSINKSINTPKSLAALAKQNNMGALALTDENAMFGSLSFYKETKAKGVKPIIGLTVKIEQDDGNSYELTLLAKNEKGYKKLIELNSKSYTENRKSDAPYAKEEWLADLSDVVILSGAKNGLIGKKILDGNIEEAKEIAKQMKDAFGDDFYIELQRDGTPDESAYMEGAVIIASELEIAPVATHPVYFKESDDFVAHEVRHCIATGDKFIDANRERNFNKEMYFKSEKEMEELFSDIPEALENTVQIGKKCNITLDLDRPQLPQFPTPNGEDVNQFFVKIAKDGLEERLKELFPNALEREKNKEVYEKRLQFEVDIIEKMGFPGYFLIVSDFITWAKEHDIPVGPGRGSGAGSLVAYAMKITDIDPMEYGLLFERFLNPDRVSMPDFDIDFCQARRGEVYEYVRQKYGTDAVCQIGTFGTLGAKAVVRDVGRALDYHYDFVDKIAKGVTIKPNNPMSLKQFIFGDEDKGIQPDEKLLERYNQETEVKKLIDVALKIEGLTRQIGKGAAGVVISASKLIDYTPLYTVDADTPPQTQYEIADVEKAGLVKFDFLGLRNLTIIKDTIDLIHKTGKEDGDKEKEHFNIKNIPIDDIEVYENIYGNGNTGGVFQFESKGISAVLQKAKPQNLKDVIAVNALYRPGPMDIIPDWLRSKSLPEDQRPYPHESLRDVLKETYGFMIYQEQVMQCAQIVAGYSLGEADLLRRAMGKKKPEEMAKQRSVFIAGAAKNGIDEQKANEIFDLIDKFSGYGFNKSHAAAYSLLSYQTAYLKYYYPEQFFAATLNSHVTTLDTDKIAICFKDAEENNLTVLGPNINESKAVFSIEGDRRLRYGLAAIKGVGEKAANVISQEREKNGPFVDFYDFMERVGRGHVNKRVLEALIKAGALDSLNENRAELFDNLKEALDYVKKYRDRQLENVSVLGSALFDDEDKPAATKTKKKKAAKELVKPEIKPTEAWPELVQSINEKQAFGYFFSSNPYNSYYAKELDGLSIASKLSDLPELFYNEGINEVIVGALVEDINWWRSKKGAFVTINDGLISTDIRMFESTLNENKDWLKKDSFILLRLKLEKNEKEDNYEDMMVASFDGSSEHQAKEKEGIETLMLSTQQAFSFEKTKELTINKLFVGAEETQDNLESFDKICNEFKSENGVDVILCVPDDKGRRTKKVNAIKVQYNEKLFMELKKQFSDEWVKATFKKDINLIDFPKLKNKNNNKQFKKRNSFSI